MTTLRTERTILRKPRGTDLPSWTAFFLSERGTFIGGGPEHDEGRAWRAFAAIIGHWDIHGFGGFVIEDRTTLRPLGLTGPWFPALWPEREIGWNAWSSEVEGTGTMFDASVAVLRHVFADLGWETAVSYIDPVNTRSRALAHRLGARQDAAASGPHPADMVLRHDRARFIEGVPS